VKKENATKVMTADIPDAFIQASLENPEDGDEKVVMKVTGMLVDLLVKVAPGIHGPCVVCENGRKVLCLQVLKALCGMLQAALLWCKKFCSDLESIGHVFNPYDPCVSNKMIDGEQHTIRFHVDNIMASHFSRLVNDKFVEWLDSQHGHCGKVKQTRGDFHHCLAMNIDFSHRGQVRIHMKDHIESMIKDFPIQFTSEDSAPAPAPVDLHATGTSPKLPPKEAQLFHTFTANALFLCKRACPDIHLAVATPQHALESRTPTKMIGVNSSVSWSSFPKPGTMNSSFPLTALALSVGLSTQLLQFIPTSKVTPPEP